MHEMGIVLNIVRSAERHAAMNNVDRLGYVIVEVGELTGVVPNYLSSLWDMGVKGTVCEGSELIIETVPGMVRCLDCGKEYPLMEHLGKDLPICPNCQKERFTVLSGREMIIKEIGVPEK